MTTPPLALAATLSALMLGGPAAIAATHAPPPDLASQQAVIDAPVKLLMVERRGCIYCEAWHNEVMPEYAKTPEGKAEYVAAQRGFTVRANAVRRELLAVLDQLSGQHSASRVDAS